MRCWLRVLMVAIVFAGVGALVLVRIPRKPEPSGFFSPNTSIWDYGRSRQGVTYGTGVWFAPGETVPRPLPLDYWRPGITSSDELANIPLVKQWRLFVPDVGVYSFTWHTSPQENLPDLGIVEGVEVEFWSL